MTNIAWTLPIPPERIEELRDLLAELIRCHMDGLDRRARQVGYHQERMCLQPDPDGAATLEVLS